jgi:ABC-type uncharacterized transport system substrate-binding protein
MAQGWPRATLVFLLILLAIVPPGRSAAAGETVLLVTSERGGAHEETAEAIRAALTQAVPASEIGKIDWRDLNDEKLTDSKVVVTVGSQAAQAVTALAPGQPVLHTLLTRAAFERLAMPRAKASRSAIFLDQPVDRQIALLAEALPGWGQVALISSPQSEKLAAALAARARERQLQVTQETVPDNGDLYFALRRALTERAVLLALPDSTVFNSYTIQNILLTAYRHRSPVVGFSPAYVRAGALLALYSTPAQIGSQAAESVRAVLDGGALPPPQSCRQFEVGINRNVARSMGIELEDGEAIAARIARGESGP